MGEDKMESGGYGKTGNESIKNPQRLETSRIRSEVSYDAILTKLDIPLLVMVVAERWTLGVGTQFTVTHYFSDRSQAISG